MIKRTGHWWNRKRVWYYKSDDAHPAGNSVSSANASLFVSVISLLITAILSYTTLTVSKQTLFLSHHPRLVVRHEEFFMDGDAAAFAIEVENMGETDATDIHLVSGRFSLLDASFPTNDIGSSSILLHSGDADFYFMRSKSTREDIDSFKDGQLIVTGEIHYRDRLNQPQQAIHICSLVALANKRVFPCPQRPPF